MKQTKLTDIYRLLLELYGNRGWWPGENQDEIAIGAILAQSVAWKNVEKALRNLKQRGVCSLAKMAELEQDELAALIVRALYYNQKAERLQRFARYFQAEAGSDFARLFGGEIDGLRSRLLSLKGLGPETVDALVYESMHFLPEFARFADAALGIAQADGCVFAGRHRRRIAEALADRGLGADIERRPSCVSRHP